MSLHTSSWSSRVFPDREAPPHEAAAMLAALRPIAGDLIGEATADRPAIELGEAYRRCVAITRQNSKSFFLTSQLLPPEKRLAVRALYAFCRTSDDIVDLAKNDPTLALARWVAHVQAPRPPADDPVLTAWGDTVRRYRIPTTLIDELLAGIAMDLMVHRYATFDDLWLYCYRVASVVGLVSMHIIGYRDGASRYAVRLGVALQLTNILRDVGEDAARGRIYLPLEDLERFGLSEAEILAGVNDDRFQALMRFEIDRANALYDESWNGIALLERDGRLAVGAAAEVYRGILNRIEANAFNVFTQRAFVPLPSKLRIVWDVRRRIGREFS